MWTCTLSPNTGDATTTSHKSITGARRAAANHMLTATRRILQDDAAWAPRTMRPLRDRVANLVTLAADVMRYDGPTSFSYLDGTVSLTQHADAPATNGRKPTVRKQEARWLVESRFPQACPSCSGEVPAGSRAWYDPKVGLFHEGCAPANAQAVTA